MHLSFIHVSFIHVSFKSLDNLLSTVPSSPFLQAPPSISIYVYLEWTTAEEKGEKQWHCVLRHCILRHHALRHNFCGFMYMWHNVCVCVCVLMQLCRLLQIQHLCNWASMTTATHCNTYCNTLQHTCSCNCRTCVIQRANTPQEHTGNTLQHTATRCNTREVALIELPQLSEQTRCNNTPQHTATHRNTPQYTATLRWLQS